MSNTITKTEITTNGTRIDTYADGSRWVNMDRVLKVGIHRVLHRFSYRLSDSTDKRN